MNELGNTPADKNYKPSGISRAEERAFAYQRELGMIDSVSDKHIVARRMGFYDGYEQAEKDLALTWEDMKEIVRIADGMMYPADSLADIEKRLGIQPYYTEVLTRFKQYKEAKQ